MRPRRSRGAHGRRSAAPGRLFPPSHSFAAPGAASASSMRGASKARGAITIDSERTRASPTSYHNALGRLPTPCRKRLHPRSLSARGFGPKKHKARTLSRETFIAHRCAVVRWRRKAATRGPRRRFALPEILGSPLTLRPRMTQGRAPSPRLHLTRVCADCFGRCRRRTPSPASLLHEEHGVMGQVADPRADAYRSPRSASSRRKPSGMADTSPPACARSPGASASLR